MSNPIGWCEKTWVPYTGCDKCSPGCENCYALNMSWRHSHNPKTKAAYEGTVKKTAGGKINWTGSIQENLSQADKPLRTKKPTMFFVNSMSDMFHEALSFDQIDQLFEIMSRCPQHVFQVLTKRAKHMYEYYDWKENRNGFNFSEWPLKNVWLGVSVENQKYAEERIPNLLMCAAAVRFLSCEPLLGTLNLNSVADGLCVLDCLQGVRSRIYDGPGKVSVPHPKIHQVIIGGESGPGARPMHPDWPMDIIKQCEAAGTAIYFKQWGAYKEDQDIKEKDNICVLNNGDIVEFGISEESYTMEEWWALKPARMAKVGKHKAGNTIDGKQYLQFPKTI